MDHNIHKTDRLYPVTDHFCPTMDHILSTFNHFRLQSAQSWGEFYHRWLTPKRCKHESYHFPSTIDHIRHDSDHIWADMVHFCSTMNHICATMDHFRLESDQH